MNLTHKAADMTPQNAMNNACEEWNQMDLFFMITTNKPTHQAED